MLNYEGANAELSGPFDVPRRLRVMRRDGDGIEERWWEDAAGWAEQMRHFLECIAGKATPRATGEDGKRALQLGLAVKQSVRARRPVALGAWAPRRQRCAPKSRGRGLRQQGEASGREVVIEGKCLTDAALAHDGEADGISQAEVLIAVAAQDGLGLSVESGVRVKREDEPADSDELKEPQRWQIPRAPQNHRVGFSHCQVRGHERVSLSQKPGVALIRPLVIAVAVI